MRNKGTGYDYGNVRKAKQKKTQERERKVARGTHSGKDEGEQDNEGEHNAIRVSTTEEGRGATRGRGARRKTKKNKKVMVEEEGEERGGGGGGVE